MAGTGFLRIGDILVARGILSDDQRQQVLETQQVVGRPFGDLAERLFGVRPEQVEDAWAEQYAAMAQRVDPTRLRPQRLALELITPRQARQFGVLPVKTEGAELVVCTTAANLARALRFLGWKVGRPACFLIAEPRDLDRMIDLCYGRAEASAA
ncbi:MAG: hypothetical protein HRU70_08895 [Phycisphaeraceae bacterium]|nr:MAG: hypothetical protein HRU70_08895 [Phycisphaeraceae bacterium]